MDISKDRSPQTTDAQSSAPRCPVHDTAASGGAASQMGRESELAIRIQARRNRLVAEWAAQRMELSPAETDAYAKAVVQTDFEESGEEDVIRKLLGDLIAAGVDASDREVRQALEEKTIEAKRAFLG